MKQLEPVPENLAVIDDEVIEQLRLDMGEETDTIIESYVESIHEFLEYFELRGDLTPEEDLHRWAHTIKSSARAIGAMRLAHVAAEMESAYGDRILIDSDNSLVNMRKEFDTALECLQIILGH